MAGVIRSEKYSAVQTTAAICAKNCHLLGQQEFSILNLKKELARPGDEVFFLSCEDGSQLPETTTCCQSTALIAREIQCTDRKI